MSRDDAQRVELERRLAAMARLPDENPNPVLRVDEAGVLLYRNDASRAILDGLGAGLGVGDALPAELMARIHASLDETAETTAELKVGPRTYSLKPVRVADLGFIALFGTDITAVRTVERFPDRNPNPVMRISDDGTLLYANAASESISSALGLTTGLLLPDPLRGDLLAAAEDTEERVVDVQGNGRWWELRAVPIPEFAFINVYATDVTAVRLIEQAHRENERLLLNILPAPIADRLRAGEKVIADRHEDLSLLMADIVGFTQLSSRMTPSEVVDLLNGLFNQIDDMVERHRLEKIKTIGDAYMVVGGLPPETDDHLARLARMALDLSDLLRTTRDGRVSMRIGLHVGPAVAGVIGTRKFVYDVWGSTVNVASRLESYGLPGEVQVSEDVQRRLADRFDFAPRGVVDLKGVGAVQTWFLRAPIPSA